MQYKAKKASIVSCIAILAIAGFFGLAHTGYAATGSISANPSFFDGSINSGPFTSYITWSASGFDSVSGAVVYVSINGAEENLFRYQNSCSGQSCPASWITPDTTQKTYEFRLYEYNSFTGWVGQRLSAATVTVSPTPSAASTGGGGGGGGATGGTPPTPSGSISANPNPCAIASGATACVSYITWTTNNVSEADVFMTADDGAEIPFHFQTACSGTSCPTADGAGQPWVSANNHFTFRLYDYSSGSRGQLFGQVTVTGTAPSGGGGGGTGGNGGVGGNACAGTAAATLTIHPSSENVLVDQTATFTALYDPDGSGCPQGQQTVNANAQWSSSNQSVAGDFGGGSFRGQSAGTAIITVMYNGLSATASMTVTPTAAPTMAPTMAPTAVTPVMSGGAGATVCTFPAPTFVITPSGTSISIGQTVTFSALYDPDGPGCPNGNQDVAVSATWSSNNPGVASSLGSGRFQGQNTNGSAAIAATYAGLAANATVNVSGANTGGGSFFTTLSNYFYQVGGAPSVLTSPATNVVLNAAALNGQVIPNNSETQAWFEYGVTPGTLPFATNFVTVGNGQYSVPFSNFVTVNSGTAYYFRAVARNGYGFAYGQVLSFNAGGGLIPIFALGTPPVSVTEPATLVSRNSALLHSTVNPAAGIATAWFEYGSSAALGLKTNPQPVGSGIAPIHSAFAFSGLSPNTTYYFRAVAQSQFGTVAGNVLSFETSSVAAQTAPIRTSTQVVSNVSKQVSCVALVPTLSARELPIGEEYTSTMTYRNGCPFDLTNATMNVTLPVEVDFLSTSYPVFTQNGNTVYYNLGTIPAGVELAITIRGTVKDTARVGDHLIFTALMGFFDAKNNYESLSTYLTAAVTQGPNGRPLLSASILATLGNFLGNWLFWILIILIILFLLYLIFRRRQARDERQIDMSAFHSS